MPTAPKPIARLARRSLERLGYRVERTGSLPAIPLDCDPVTRATVEVVQPFTLTPPARIMALCNAVRYIQRLQIPGAIVECGVWRGGSMMATARTLLESEGLSRELFLYDTFTAFPEPDAQDTQAWGNTTPSELYETITSHPVFAHVPLEQVRKAIEATGFPGSSLHMVQGLVEETIPAQAPDLIALCRLDTDWYRSTKHELEHLVGRIVPGGVLIIDDYGEFDGARRAVDEYVAEHDRDWFLHRVDESCRLVIV